MVFLPGLFKNDVECIANSCRFLMPLLNDNERVEVSNASRFTVGQCLVEERSHKVFL